MSSLEAPPPSRGEKVLAAIIASTMGLSFLSFFAIIIGTWRGMQREDFAEGLVACDQRHPTLGSPRGFHPHHQPVDCFYSTATPSWRPCLFRVGQRSSSSPGSPSAMKHS
jgi:hypothetical protein